MVWSTPESEKRTKRLRPVRGGERTRRSRSRWLRILRKEFVLPALVAIVSGVVVLMVEYGVFAQSAPSVAQSQSWSTKGFADKVGAYSGGQVGVLDDGQVYLRGTIYDTEADNRMPALRIEVTYKDKPLWISQPYAVRGGKGAHQTIGWQALPGGAQGMLLGADVTRVRVSECLTVRGTNGNPVLAPEGCAGYNEIYPLEPHK